MFKTIDEILEEIGEDKYQNLSTTSFKFKKDVWEFFEGSDKLNCVEFGTHKGQTTRVLSHLFDKGLVYTINLPGHFDSAKKLNFDRTNIKYVGFDLYQTSIEENFNHKPISVFFIDAVHTESAVLTDVARTGNMKLANGDIYYIFDDYGLERPVWQAVNQMMYVGKLEKVQYIGHEPNTSFGGQPERSLKDWEGIICKLCR